MRISLPSLAPVFRCILNSLSYTDTEQGAARAKFHL